MCCCHILWEFHSFAVDGAWTETIICVGLFYGPVWFGPLYVIHGAGAFTWGIRLLVNTVQKILILFIQNLLKFPGINCWQMTERIWLSVSMYVRREFLPVKHLEDAWDLLNFTETCMVWSPTGLHVNASVYLLLGSCSAPVGVKGQLLSMERDQEGLGHRLWRRKIREESSWEHRK